MKHRDISSDDAIDRLLTGLREVEPPQGMQQRVLHAAKERASTRRRLPFQLPFSAKYSWIVTTTSIAAIAIAASWMIARSHRAAHESTHSSAHLAQANAPVSETHLTSLPIPRPRPAHEPKRVSTEQPAMPVEPISDEDALALSEMNAPSHPAPPMPLTDQEKLLMRLVRKGDPVELAMLDPKMRSGQFTDSKAEFERFFAQPEPSKVNQSTADTEPAVGKSK